MEASTVSLQKMDGFSIPSLYYKELFTISELDGVGHGQSWRSTELPGCQELPLLEPSPTVGGMGVHHHSDLI